MAVTEIVEIVAPDEAPAGSRVDITVSIRNLHTTTVTIGVGAELEYGVTPRPTVTFRVSYANVPPGGVYSFTGHFTMPESDVTIHAFSYFWDTATMGWIREDEETKTVRLAVVAPPPLPKAEIVRLMAPSEALAGETFTVTVTLKNVGAARGVVNCILEADGIAQEGGVITLDPGQTHDYVFHILMPSKDLSGRVSAWSWDGTTWRRDDEEVFAVRLKEVVRYDFIIGRPIITVVS